MMHRWLLGALFIACAYLSFNQLVVARPIVRGPGVVAEAPPVQRNLEADASVFDKDGFRIVALAELQLTARVLHTRRYYGWGKDSLVPVDVAFGWGRMSDEAVLADIDIDQYRRFYFWSYQGSPPIPRREIETSSANMHLIPTTGAIERSLKGLRPGNIVTLRGYLVEARGDDGFVWRSSLGRGDTGNGACELVWVEELEAT
jgi:hypothetical protein